MPRRMFNLVLLCPTFTLCSVMLCSVTMAQEGVAATKTISSSSSVQPSSALTASERETVTRLLSTLPEKYLGCPAPTLEQLKGSSSELETDFVNLYFLRHPDSSGHCKAVVALFKQTLGTPFTLAVHNLTTGFQGLPTFLEFRKGRWLDVTKKVLPNVVLRLERPKVKSRLARDGSGLLIAPFDGTDDFSKLLYTLEWKRGQLWPLEMKTSR